MKKSISAFLVAILMISLTACGGDVNQEIDKRYRELQSYTAESKVTVTGNKGPMEYGVSQSYRAPDSYRAEITKPERMAGTVGVITGQEVWLRGADAPAMKLELGTLDQEMEVLFLLPFLEEYFNQETLPELVPNQDGLVQLILPKRGTDRYRFTQNLWIDAKTHLPVWFVTYDMDGNEVVRVEYESFVPNIEIEDSVFLP